MKRRQVMKLGFVAPTAACPVCLSAVRAAPARSDADAHHRGYECGCAPENGGDPSPNTGAPDLDVHHSPMDLVDNLHAKGRVLYRYDSSLTTPPSSKRAIGTVFKQPAPASAQSVGHFADLFPSNDRPVQPLHRRSLLEAVLAGPHGTAIWRSPTL